MTNATSLDVVAVGAHCLQQIETLKHELETAMDAIAHNCLSDFEHSLWQQEMLSSGMRRSLFLLRGLSVDPALMKRVREEYASLQQTGRSYGQLVEQSSRSTAVLRDLCSLYQHAPPQLPGVRQQALSYEA